MTWCLASSRARSSGWIEQQASKRPAPLAPSPAGAGSPLDAGSPGAALSLLTRAVEHSEPRVKDPLLGSLPCENRDNSANSYRPGPLTRIRPLDEGRQLGLRSGRPIGHKAPAKHFPCGPSHHTPDLLSAEHRGGQTDQGGACFGCVRRCDGRSYGHHGLARVLRHNASAVLGVRADQQCLRLWARAGMDHGPRKGSHRGRQRSVCGSCWGSRSIAAATARHERTAESKLEDIPHDRELWPRGSPQIYRVRPNVLVGW
jgi:hypothetical protein